LRLFVWTCEKKPFVKVMSFGGQEIPVRGK
jgi:hypothetical protein